MKVRITRKDFRDAVKVCRLRGHSICRCVVARAVIRTGVVTPETASVGYSQFNGYDNSGKSVGFDCSDNKMSEVVNIFDNGYELKSSDKLYKEARLQNVLNLEFVPST
jgi:hypothetical protein